MRRLGTDKIVSNDFGQPKAGRSPSAWMRESRIQTGLGLFVPCGLRAKALVANCWRSWSNHIGGSHPSLGTIYKKAPLNEVLFIGNAVGVETEEFKQA